MLYLSYFFKKKREQYYARLQAVRDEGAFEQWVEFFLTGVEEVSRESTDTARKIQGLREENRALIQQKTKSTTGLVLLDKLFVRPITTVRDVATIIERSYPVANQLVSDLVSMGLLKEVTGQRRNRVFRYQPYLDVFDA